MKRVKKNEGPLIKNRINSIEEDESPRSSGHSGKKVILITAVIALLAVTAVLVMVAIHHEKPGSFLSQLKKETTDIRKKPPLDSIAQKPLPESKNEHIRRGKESYLKKYYRDASAEFNEVLESGAGDSDKAIALTYLGMISTDTENYGQAVKYFRRALLYDKDNPEILKHLALALRYKKDYNEAVSQIKLSLEKRPGDVDALILLGNIYFETGRYSDAADQYRRALETEPENATLLYNLATALIKTGDDFAATEYLKKAASIDRLGEVAHRSLSMLGILFMEKGDFNQAENYLKKALALRPGNAVDHYNLGIAYLRLSKNDDALQEFSRAEEHSDDEGKMLENLGNMYSRLNRYDKSISVYKKLLRGNSRNIRILSRMGEIYYKKGELDKAYDIYKKIPLIEPAGENARNAYLNMGNILDDAQRFDEAIEAYKKAVSINPKDRDAHYNLGIAYKHAQRPELAISSWKEAARLDPSNPAPRLAIADYYYENKFPDLAEKEYQDILQQWPEIQEAHFKMGSIYYRRNQLTYALKAFKRTAKLNESSELAMKSYINMALINSQLNPSEKGIEESINMVQKALLIKPGNPEALLSFGILYAKKEMTGRAIDTFYQVIKNTTDPSLLAQAYNNIGKTYFKKKEYKKALQAFTRALEETPSSEEIRMNRKAAVQAYENQLALEK